MSVDDDGQSCRKTPYRLFREKCNTMLAEVNCTRLTLKRIAEVVIRDPSQTINI